MGTTKRLFISLLGNKKEGKLIRRYVGHQHLNAFKWFVYSPSKRGFFCKYCPIFNLQNQGGFQKNVNLQKLVTQPLVKFAKILCETGDLKHHERTQYHKEAIEFGKKFLETYKPNLDVHNLLNEQPLAEVNEIESVLSLLSKA